MLYLDEFFGIALLALWVFCVVDVATTADGACRGLPKPGWLAIVIVLPMVGSIAWLVAGRPWPNVGGVNRPVRPISGFPEYERLGRSVPASADEDEEFLRKCRARAEEQRRRNEQQRREREGEP